MKYDPRPVRPTKVGPQFSAEAAVLSRWGDKGGETGHMGGYAKQATAAANQTKRIVTQGRRSVVSMPLTYRDE